MESGYFPVNVILLPNLPLFFFHRKVHTIYLNKIAYCHHHHYYYYLPEYSKYIIKIFCYLHQWFCSRDSYETGHTVWMHFWCLNWRNCPGSNDDWSRSNFNTTFARKLCFALCKTNTYVLWLTCLKISKEKMLTQILGTPL